MNLASSSNQVPNAATNSTNVSFTFNTLVKLDKLNYLIWRSQVLASIRGNKLKKLIDEIINPPHFHITQGIGVNARSVENLDYVTWRS